MSRGKAFDPDAALDRAVELFWRCGYDGASLTMLLAAMDISRQSLYDTFGDKRRLYIAALGRYRARLRAELEALLSAQASPLGAIRAMFMWVHDDVVRTPARRSCLMANAALELGQRDPEIRELVADHLAEVEELFFAMLREGQRAGELDDDRDARALARFLTSSIHGLGVLARGGASGPAVRDTIRTTLAVVGAQA